MEGESAGLEYSTVKLATFIINALDMRKNLAQLARYGDARYYVSSGFKGKLKSYREVEESANEECAESQPDEMVCTKHGVKSLSVNHC